MKLPHADCFARAFAAFESERFILFANGSCLAGDDAICRLTLQRHSAKVEIDIMNDWFDCRWGVLGAFGAEEISVIKFAVILNGNGYAAPSCRLETNFFTQGAGR